MTEQMDLIAQISVGMEKGPDAWWVELAVAEIRRIARRRQELTTDDVWRTLRPAPCEKRSMGAAMLKAQRLGLIHPTSFYIPLGSHGRPIRVWQSDVYQGAI